MPIAADSGHYPSDADDDDPDRGHYPAKQEMGWPAEVREIDTYEV